MSSAKKKTSTKRNSSVKYAAKPQSRAASAATATTRSSADWVKSSAAQWQQGAQDWAKQSAKLYQFPNDATEAAKSATEGMMNFAQQMFGQSKQGFSSESFNAQDAQEKFSQFARESVEQINKSASGAQSFANESMKLVRENGEVLVEVSNIAITVGKELSAETVSYLNKLFAQNVELGKQVLTCRTLNDLFDLSSRFMKTNLDSFFSESVKLSEKLFQCATDISEPLNECMSETSERLSKALTA